MNTVHMSFCNRKQKNKHDQIPSLFLDSVSFTNYIKYHKASDSAMKFDMDHWGLHFYFCQ